MVFTGALLTSTQLRVNLNLKAGYLGGRRLRPGLAYPSHLPGPISKFKQMAVFVATGFHVSISHRVSHFTSSVSNNFNIAISIKSINLSVLIYFLTGASSAIEEFNVDGPVAER